MRIADNEKKRAGAITNQEASETGGSPTIQRGQAEVIGIKRPQRGEDRRQYREDRQRLYESRGHRGGRITYNTEEYTQTLQESSSHSGWKIANNTERKSRGHRNQEATEGAISPRIQRGHADATGINRP